MDTRTLLLFIGVGAIFVAIAIGVYSLFAAASQTGVDKAIKTIDTVYAANPRDRSIVGRDGTFGPAIQQVTSMGRNFTPRSATARLQRWLDYAGNPAAWPPERVLEMQGIALLLCGVVGFLLALLIGANIVWLIFLTALFAAIGFWLPFIVVYDLGVRRQQEIRRQLPDAMDLLTLSVEAGLGFEAAIAHIVATMPGALTREFARMLHEMQMGMNRADALRAVGGRTTILELKAITTSLLQATELGVPITDVLREQSKEMRVKRRQNAEAQAAKVPVKVVFPLVICLLPALFIIVLGPGVIRILESVF
ncbi:MAG: type II secretion system F family protein [Catenulispora sp.]|nr:type II secretion system F family protein [Catenulispora sp.]